MAVKVGELYALLRLDKAQWDKGLKDAERGIERLSKKADQLVKVGKTVTAAVTLPIVGIGVAAVKMASDVEQAGGKFNVSFRSMARTSRETLNQLSSDMQRSRFEMQAMAADAQAILSPMLQNVELAAQLSVALSALTVDLASYMNLTDRDTHQRLISGLLGSTQATEILGISLRATTLQAEAERLGIQANIATLDDATQIRLRFIAILRQSIDAQTDAIRSGESFESQLRALQADVKDLAVTLGQDLLPLGMAFVRWARDLAGSLKELSPESREALIQFALMAATVGPLAIGLGKVVQGVSLTGRALIALTQFARANPLVLLGFAAAGAALAIEGVRDKIDDLFEAMGVGAPFEFVENLFGAFSELESLVSGLDFDPQGAQEEAMERLRKMYRETLEALENDLRNGFSGVSDAARMGISELADVWREAEREAMRRRLMELTGEPTADVLRLATEKSIFVRGITGSDAERERLETELQIQWAQVAAVSKRRSLIEGEIAQNQKLRQELQEQLDLAVSGVENIDVVSIVAQMNKLDDVTLTGLHKALRDTNDELKALELQVGLTADRIAALSVRRPVTELPIAGRPEILPGEQAIENELRRLQLRVDADLLPIGDAVEKLHQMRAQLIALAQASGGLMYANDEQLRLYVDLTRALDEWLDSLESVPSRLDEIRADLERAMGVGMSVEREIARATGADFDPRTFQMDVLRRTITEMVGVTGEITPEVENYLRELRKLAREHERLTTAESAARSGLDALGRGLGPVGRLLASSTTFDASKGLAGFGFNASSFMAGAVGVGIDLLFSAIGGLDDSSQALERAAEALESASESWRQTLAEGQFHELVTASPAGNIEELRRARNAAQHEIAQLEKRWLQVLNAASRGARIRELQDVIKEIDKTIKELQTESPGQLESRIEELLGVTTRGLQGAVSGAFSASTAEDFAANIEGSLTGRVRNAFVTAFLESSMMSPLFESLGDQIREALLDVDISPDEMTGIRAIMDEIKERSTPLYELLDEMGLLADTTERLNREFDRLVNVPLGFRAIQALRFQASTPQSVSALMGGDGAAAPLSIGQIVLPNVTNAAQFERELRNLQRRDSLRRTGNPTALQRVRR